MPRHVCHVVSFHFHLPPSTVLVLSLGTKYFGRSRAAAQPGIDNEVYFALGLFRGRTTGPPGSAKTRLEFVLPLSLVQIMNGIKVFRFCRIRFSEV